MTRSRRRFLKHSALIGAAAVSGGLWPSARVLGQGSTATGGKRPIRIIMGGYGPASTGFSLALKKIGDRLASKFGDQVDIKYVGWDIPNEFVVGYGLDYNEKYRNLRDIGTLAPHVYS